MPRAFAIADRPLSAATLLPVHDTRHAAPNRASRVIPDTRMCPSSRMVVKRCGAARPHVVACTLIPYDLRFDLGPAFWRRRRGWPSTIRTAPVSAFWAVRAAADAAGSSTMSTILDQDAVTAGLEPPLRPFTTGRRLVGEALGTGLLLAVVVGSGIMGERLCGGIVAVALLGNTLATGAALVVLVTILGPLSGAHFRRPNTHRDALRMAYVVVTCRPMQRSSYEQDWGQRRVGRGKQWRDEWTGNWPA